MKQLITNCKFCKYHGTRNYYSSDGYDRMEDWYCKKNEQKIQGAVEWHEENKIPIPDWCPESIQVIRNERIEKILQ